MPELNPSLPKSNPSISQKIQLSSELMQAGVMHTLGENAAAIIHELRNPLQTIRAYIQLVERTLASQTSEPKYFTALYAEINRMEGLLNQYLRLSRFAPAELKPLNLTEKVNEMLPLLRSMAVMRGIELEADLPASITSCQCDEEQFKRLLLNLVANACDACREQPQPHVRITLREDGLDIALSVLDNGCGIPPEKLEKIWQPFYTNKSGGTGLGLPSCATIAAEHGGTLTVVSEAGQGSCFTLTLPLQNA